MLFSDAIKDKNDLLEKIEELLILSDIGPGLTNEILEKFEYINLHQFKVKDFNFFKKELKNILLEMIPNNKNSFEIKPDKLNIIMVVGVNGTGKTSFTGKLSYYFRNKGNNVLLVPADTYRAGAISQLTLLGNDSRVETLKTSEGADPASVVFDGIQSALAKKKDLILIDTAGRLHTQQNLMKELEKVKKVIIKAAQDSIFKIILVIDATTGQNGLAQAKYFNKCLNISDLALTKLDGTAKGGIVLSIQKDLSIPVSFITFGEKISDLSKYESDKFIEAILD
ncbi:MAG: signal recognition particle-docking protein FtsY [Candidatus Caldatribacteriota bacterium]|nr:signal recognition particle-docking protein FtsY [Atribacterota bacterium]MDD3031026.1 signal recognition particle-docking protein FtsY [Atribacterota bacterium]MDD3640195.1 signal recognition particle-docking protein FtsY [Atribacterota bacterium]MDD4288531.1 signal recognition particle-docking protein FtsY [Atribacterota bacterium]MDD4764701.1 signal recognition particle-docking protein FtsY [Atribacterota bacterium]